MERDCVTEGDSVMWSHPGARGQICVAHGQSRVVMRVNCSSLKRQDNLTVPYVTCMDSKTDRDVAGELFLQNVM